jgi:PAS domain S-box-containing protein
LPHTPNIKVLVVDDLPEKLLVYESVLDGLGVDLVLARSGQDALRQVLEHDFAVILLDVNMPGMDGYETAATIRSRRRSALTPIIFVTAHADELHALKGYSYGAVDYILSPVVPEVLRTKVRAFADLHRLHQQVRDQAERDLTLANLERAHLTALLEQATDFVGRVSVHGRLLHINRAGQSMLGLTEEPGAGELPHFSDIVRQGDAAAALAKAHEKGVWFGEMSLARRDAQQVPVAVVILAHRSPHGDLESLSVIARDITARKHTEAELARHRDRLEHLVLERTRELEVSHERLRLADRLASVGTLTAGLGHDMGNLLLPVRMHLASLERLTLPHAAHHHLGAIKTACDYLQRLCHGLRLFALDPDKSIAGETTSLSTWWPAVETFLRNTLPKGISLEEDFAADLPALALAPHMLTQIVHNLVQNAGEAMRARGSGRVRIAARAISGADSMEFTVSDDGPGMSPEVRARCMEPFFTTRTRRISTGLGLALVHGLVTRVHGQIEIQSEPGHGTAFRLTLPLPKSAPAAQPAWFSAQQPSVRIALADRRLAAYLGTLLQHLRVPTTHGPWAIDDTECLLVTDSTAGREDAFRQYLDAAGPSARQVLLLTSAPNQHPSGQVTTLDPSHCQPADIRGALQRLINSFKPNDRRAADFTDSTPSEASHACYQEVSL